LSKLNRNNILRVKTGELLFTYTIVLFFYSCM